MSGITAMKEELVGLSTASVLALIGFALYTTTYSLVYASSASKPVVAVLEMWIISLHLISSLVCLVLHFVAMTVFEVQSQISSVLTSLFLGLGLLSTIACNACLADEALVCKAYFGAAAFPKFAAVGLCVWCWVMYMSSLGGQAWSVGVSLGFSQMGCILAASVIIMAPYNIGTKLASVCNHRWLCSDTCIDYGIMIVIFSSICFMVIGEILRQRGRETKSTGKRRKGIVIYLSFLFRLIACIIMILGILISMISQPSSQYSIHILCSLICCVPFFSILLFRERADVGQYEAVPTYESESEKKVVASTATAMNFQNFIQNQHATTSSKQCI